MSFPLPTLIRDFRSDLDQTLNEPLYWPFHLLATEIELPEHVQEVIREDSYEQPGLVQREAVATGLIPAHHILALFDPVLKVAAIVVYTLTTFPTGSLELVTMNTIPGEECPM
jgi:hypothetical protein